MTFWSASYNLRNKDSGLLTRDRVSVRLEITSRPQLCSAPEKNTIQFSLCCPIQNIHLSTTKLNVLYKQSWVEEPSSFSFSRYSACKGRLVALESLDRIYFVESSSLPPNDNLISLILRILACIVGAFNLGSV